MKQFAHFSIIPLRPKLKKIFFFQISGIAKFGMPKKIMPKS